ncbi:MAG: hypothetical protein ACLVI6_03210 [Bifidobacterium bifidum]
MHPLSEANGREYVQLVTWDKGLSHIAGNVNGNTIRHFPVVTEVSALHRRRLTLPTEDGGVLECSNGYVPYGTMPTDRPPARRDDTGTDPRPADVAEGRIRASALFITHDFGVVAQIAGKVAVMYAGRLLETGDVYDVFDHPAHPYTAGLLKTRPVIGRRIKRLYSLHDQFPDPAVFGRGTSRAGRAAPRTG